MVAGNSHGHNKSWATMSRGRNKATVRRDNKTTRRGKSRVTVKDSCGQLLRAIISCEQQSRATFVVGEARKRTESRATMRDCHGCLLVADDDIGQSRAM